MLFNYSILDRSLVNEEYELCFLERFDGDKHKLVRISKPGTRITSKRWLWSFNFAQAMKTREDICVRMEENDKKLKEINNKMKEVLDTLVSEEFKEERHDN